MTHDEKRDLLGAAVVGYSSMIETFSKRLRDLDAQLFPGLRRKAPPKPDVVLPATELERGRNGRRRLSAAGRKAIAAAQRKRWASLKAQQAKATGRR